MFGLFGCAKKYEVDYCGQQMWYAGAKDSYKVGQTVHLEYGPIATDTNYYFEANVEPFSCQGENNCFIIEFVMPAHDVVIECRFEPSTANKGN